MLIAGMMGRCINSAVFRSDRDRQLSCISDPHAVLLNVKAPVSLWMMKFYPVSVCGQILPSFSPKQKILYRCKIYPEAGGENVVVQGIKNAGDNSDSFLYV
jgi:hypothetical protein